MMPEHMRKLLLPALHSAGQTSVKHRTKKNNEESDHYYSLHSTAQSELDTFQN